MSQESPVAVHETGAPRQPGADPHAQNTEGQNPYLDSPISDSGDIGAEVTDSPLDEELLQPDAEDNADSVGMDTQNQSTAGIVMVYELEDDSHSGAGGSAEIEDGAPHGGLPPRTISVTSDDLLGVDDFEHFEVLDTTGEIDPPPPLPPSSSSHPAPLPSHHPHKASSIHHSNTGEDSINQGSPDPKGGSHDDIAADKKPTTNSPRETKSHSPRKESGGKEKSKKRAISPILFEKASDRSSKRERPTSSGKTRDKQKDHHNSGPHRVVDKLFSNTRYFVIKSNNFENINIAKDKSVWSTPPYNEKKLNKAYRDCRNVILIFSVRESGRFQGIARLASDARHDVPHVPWVLPPGISQAQLGGVFKLDWLHKGTLEFSVCMELKNPWNDNKPVKISRDGQEIEPTVGEKLCRLWQKIDSDDDVLLGPHHHHSSSSSTSASGQPMSRGDRHHHSTGSGTGGGGSSSSSSSASQQQQPHYRHFPPTSYHHNPYVPFGYPHPMGHLFPGPPDARSRLPMPPPSLYHQPSKQHMSEAEALLDARKKQQDGASSSSSSHKPSSSSSSSRGYHRRVETTGSSSSHSPPPPPSHRHRRHSSDRGGPGYEREGAHRDRTRRVERSREQHHGGRDVREVRGVGERKPRHVSRKSEKDRRRRSRSRSGSDASFEEDFGVRKETLLHGSYADYIKEYSRSKAPSGSTQSVADIATAYHKALSKVATALAQQGETEMSPKAYSQKVEEFLAKTRNGQPMGSKE